MLFFFYFCFTSNTLERKWFCCLKKIHAKKGKKKKLFLQSVIIDLKSNGHNSNYLSVPYTRSACWLTSKNDQIYFIFGWGGCNLLGIPLYILICPFFILVNNTYVNNNIPRCKIYASALNNIHICVFIVYIKCN